MSALIRWQTRSKYAHAAILVDEENDMIIESWPGKGVQLKQITDWRGVDTFEVIGQLAFNEADAHQFLKVQIGKKYDYLGVLQFLTREKPGGRWDKEWFCSELVYAALFYAGGALFQTTDPWRIYPGLLALSPYLQRVSRA